MENIKKSPRHLGTPMSIEMCPVKKNTKEERIRVSGEDVGGNDRHALSREMR